MQEYDSNLIRTIDYIGGNPPDVTDAAFVKRALSERSPPALVAMVGSRIENIDEHPAWQTLSDFERARVFGVLLRHEEAAELYRKVVNDENLDLETHGRALANLACHVKSPEEKLACLAQAALLGNEQGVAMLGQHLMNNGKFEEGLKVMLDGITKGNKICFVVLAYFLSTQSETEIISIGEQMLLTAERSGMLPSLESDEADAAIDSLFDEVNLMIKEGNGINIRHLFREIRTSLAGQAGV